jgi:1-acyl-sn-glycerol-3-phosphate acyltransferase
MSNEDRHGSFKKNPLVYIPLTIWAWIIIVSAVVLTFPLQLLVFLITYPFDKKRYISGRLFRQVIVFANRFNPLWDFKVHKLEQTFKRPPNPKTIVVCNHSSLCDPILCSLLPWEMKFLTKSSVFNIPVFGWEQRFAGDIGIVRTARDSIKDAMAKCKRWLDVGCPIIFFPEGTRSADDELLPFKDGAFRLAIENQADILPCALAGTAPALRKGSFLMGFSRGFITVGKPISTKDMKLEDVEKLREMTRAQIIELLKEIRPLSDTLVVKSSKGASLKIEEDSEQKKQK